MNLVDTHCHLDMIQDEKIVLLRAKEAGVGTIINVGTSIEASKKSIGIAEGTDLVDIYATCGIHAQEGQKDIKKYGNPRPVILGTSEARTPESDSGQARMTGLAACMDELRKVAKSSKKVVAIGECGMDYFEVESAQGKVTSQKERKEQKELFEAQVKLAVDLDLPLIIHCRNAWDDTFRLIEKYSSSESKTSREVHKKFSTLRFNSGQASSNNKKADSGPFEKSQDKQALRLPSGQLKGSELYRTARMTEAVRGLFHSWTGTVEQAKRALDLGFYISFSGIVTFKNSGVIPEVARMVPDERILVETDSPFLSPVPLRGKQNEPKNVRITAQFIAELRGVSLDRIAEITTRNAHKLFKLVNS